MTKYFNTPEEAIQNAQEKARNSDEFYGFDGQNCHDLDDNNCIGWDGLSRRYSCGNRRVYWETYQVFGKYNVYASAY